MRDAAGVSLVETQIPPQNLEAEESVLGAMLLSPKAIEAVADVLEPGDFYLHSNGLVYESVLQMYGSGQEVDVITLMNEMEQRGRLESAGGRVRLHELARVVPATANVSRYAEIVHEKAVARGLIEAGQKIAQLGWEGTEQGVQTAEELVMALAPRRTSHSTVFGGSEVAHGFREKVEEARNFMGDEILGVQAPWPFLRPLKGSRLYTLAGYTSDGKSASALQFFDAAAGAGDRPMLVSNEMSEEDLTARLVSQAGIPHHMCDSGLVSAEFRSVMEERLAQIESWEFRLLDDEGINLAGIRRQTRLFQPGLLIIDHLHQFGWTERRELEMLILGIRSLAREYDIPVLLLAQLNRSGDYKEPFPRPSLPRLKETSMLEQASDTVWFIWRPRDEFYQPKEHTEFLIAKNRGGGLDYHHLEFKSQFVRFDPKKAS